MDEVGDVFILDNYQQFIQISPSSQELFGMALGIPELCKILLAPWEEKTGKKVNRQFSQGDPHKRTGQVGSALGRSEGLVSSPLPYTNQADVATQK